MIFVPTWGFQNFLCVYILTRNNQIKKLICQDLSKGDSCLYANMYVYIDLLKLKVHDVFKASVNLPVISLWDVWG